MMVQNISRAHRTQSFPLALSVRSQKSCEQEQETRKQEHSATDPEQKCGFWDLHFSLLQCTEGDPVLVDLSKHETLVRFLFKTPTRHPAGLEREEKFIFLASSPSEQQIRTGSFKEGTKNTKSFGRKSEIELFSF